MTNNLQTSDTRFAQHSRHSNPGTFKAALTDSGKTVPEWVTWVQSNLIYDTVAKPFYGVTLSDERAEDIHLRSVGGMLTRLASISDLPISEARPPTDRLAARCSGFALLLVAALRQNGTAARCRAGFANYFKPGFFEDHWTAEVLDQKTGRWMTVDPQFDEVWQRQLGIDHNIYDVPRDRFLSAAETWKQLRSGQIDRHKVGITHVDRYGLYMSAGSLVRDLAALNLQEMLPWDVWGCQPSSDEEMGAESLALFDELADALQELNLRTLVDNYCQRDGLKVPSKVMNALKGRLEAV